VIATLAAAATLAVAFVTVASYSRDWRFALIAHFRTHLALASWIVLLLVALVPMSAPPKLLLLFAAFGAALAPSCLNFVSQASLDADLPRRLGLRRACVPVVNTRSGIGKAAMRNNDALPVLQVDPQTYEVFADGELLTCEPADVLPMAQRYFLL